MALKAGYKGIKNLFELQLKKLAEAVTIGGVSKTTVDDAITALALEVTANTTHLGGFTFVELEVNEPETVNTNADTVLNTALSVTNKIFFVVSALWQNKNNDGFYSGVGNATIAFDTTLRLNTSSSDYLGKKCKVLIAYKDKPAALISPDPNDDTRSIEPEPVTKTTRSTKKTATTKEGE